jgi:hypothetical protein
MRASSTRPAAGRDPAFDAVAAALGGADAHAAALETAAALHNTLLRAAMAEMSYPWAIENIHAKPDRRHLLAIGPTQSGKTRVMCEAAFLAMNLQPSITPIILFHTSTAAFVQFKERWEGSFQQDLLRCDNGFFFKFGVPTLVSEMKDTDFRDAFSRKSRNILTCALVNKAQIGKLRSWLSRKWDPDTHGRYAIITDEADMHVPEMTVEHQ